MNTAITMPGSTTAELIRLRQRVGDLERALRAATGALREVQRARLPEALSACEDALVGK